MRQRILGAAFKAFTENGYARTSTLEIATRAKVSKRDLYASFTSKQAMLVSCIKARSSKMQLPAELCAPLSRRELESTLTLFAANLVAEASHPSVTAMFRLAISEANGAPEVAQALEESRKANRRTVKDLVAHSQAAGLLPAGDSVRIATKFLALLWEDLQVGLLLGVVARPTPTEIEQRAARATADFLHLYPVPPKVEPEEHKPVRKARGRALS
jgi:AcrR family transcriptional regulator